MNKQEYKPLTKEQYNSIKAGDVIERMLAFCIPVYLLVSEVDDKLIYTGKGGWTFDRNTGLEIDEDISHTVSYISKILTEEEIKTVKEKGKLIKLEETNDKSKPI